MTINALIVDTENYAGNHEREMCAFLTGQIGDCGVGEELVKEAQKTIKHIAWWNKHIIQVADDSFCKRPVNHWETPGWFNNGLGKNYQDIPENEDIAVSEAVQYMENYNRGRVNEATCRLNEKDFQISKVGWTEENCKNILESSRADIERVSVLQKYPAHLSVAIFVDELPSEEIWNEFQERAEYFAKNMKKLVEYAASELKITGFRQVIK